MNGSAILVFKHKDSTKSKKSIKTFFTYSLEDWEKLETDCKQFKLI